LVGGRSGALRETHPGGGGGRRHPVLMRSFIVIYCYHTRPRTLSQLNGFRLEYFKRRLSDVLYMYTARVYILTISWETIMEITRNFNHSGQDQLFWLITKLLPIRISFGGSYYTDTPYYITLLLYIPLIWIHISYYPVCTRLFLNLAGFLTVVYVVCGEYWCVFVTLQSYRRLENIRCIEKLEKRSRKFKLLTE